MRSRLGLLLSMLLVPSMAQAARYPSPPPRGSFIVDEAGLLGPKEEQEVSAAAAALFADQQLPLFVVTINSLGAWDASGESIESYATGLFNAWGIGSKDRNAGMLLVVSVGDRKARIELGEEYGHAHDAEARTVMSNLIVPAFKRGDYVTGIRDGVKGMDAMARGLQLPHATMPRWFWPAVIGGALGLLALVVSLFRSGRSGWGWAVIAAVGALFLFLLFRRGRGNSGLGGGSSGGGGATGSW